MELKRFRQAVRAEVREHVRRFREAPPLSLYASRGGNCRRVLVARVGAAQDEAEVRSLIREGVIDAGSRWAAVGRLLHARAEQGRPSPVGVFGLVVVAGSGEREAWEVPIRAGVVGAWVEGTFDTGSSGDLLARALAEGRKENGDG